MSHTAVRATTAASSAQVVLVTAMAPVLWASSFVVTTGMLPDGRPLFSACARVLPATVVLMLVVRRLPRGVWWRRTAILGVTNIGFFFPMQFLAAYRLPGGLASSIQAASPLMIIALAWLLLGERPGYARVGAGIAGLAGVALLVIVSVDGIDGWGATGAVGALSSIAVGSVLLKRWRTDESVIVLLAWQLAAGSVVLVPLALALEGPPPALDATALAGYAWLGLMSTVVAQACWLHGLTRMPAGSAGMIGLLYPVVATAIGVCVAGETFGSVQLLGMTVVLLSVVAGQPSVTARVSSVARLARLLQRPPRLGPSHPSLTVDTTNAVLSTGCPRTVCRRVP